MLIIDGLLLKQTDEHLIQCEGNAGGSAEDGSEAQGGRGTWVCTKLNSTDSTTLISSPSSPFSSS